VQTCYHWITKRSRQNWLACWTSCPRNFAGVSITSRSSSRKNQQKVCFEASDSIQTTAPSTASTKVPPYPTAPLSLPRSCRTRSPSFPNLCCGIFKTPQSCAIRPASRSCTRSRTTSAWTKIKSRSWDIETKDNYGNYSRSRSQCPRASTFQAVQTRDGALARDRTLLRHGRG